METQRGAQMFKKGDKVLVFGSWNDRGAVSASLITIESWGKVQGTATIAHNGKFTKARYYTDRVITAPSQMTAHRTVMIRANDCVDVNAFAMECGHAIIAAQRAHYARCLTTSDHPGYLRAIQSNIDALQAEPTLIDRR